MSKDTDVGSWPDVATRRQAARDNFVRQPLTPVGWLCTVLGALILLPIRLIIGLLVLLGYYVVVKLALLGHSNFVDPLPTWRRTLVAFPLRWTARTLLWCLGFYWIRRRNSKVRWDGHSLPKPSVIIGNHCSYAEVLAVTAEYGPCFVSAERNLQYPVFGFLIQALQNVTVDRTKKSKDHSASSMVINRIKLSQALDDAGKPSYPPLAMFPEGTTTVGHSIINFHTGAFLGGGPVLPLIFHYSFHPSYGFDPAFSCVSLFWHILGMFSQPIQHMEIQYLPMYHPSSAEQADPKLYARNVRALMSKQGGLPLVDLEWKDKLQFEPSLVAMHTMGTADSKGKSTKVE